LIWISGLEAGEPVSQGIQNPRVVTRTFNTGVKADSLAGQLPGGAGARVGQAAEGLALNITFFFPDRKVAQAVDLGGLLHPLDHIEHVDEVDVVPVQHLADEIDELLLVALVRLQPGRVEVQAQRSPVGAEMSVEVIPQHPAELIPVGNV